MFTATAPPDVHARFAELLDSMPAIGRTWKAPEMNVASPSRPTLISRAGESSEMAAGGLPDLSQFELLRQEMNDALGQSAISAASIDDWERTVIRYGRATRDRPARILQADLSRDLTELTRLLNQRSSASALRRLTRVAAQMSGLMCLIFCLLDDRTGFRSWARTARIAAAEAGDPETLSWVLAQEAHGHYYSGDILEAIEVARNAYEVSRTPCIGAALAAALEARAQATTRNQRETREALDRAESILSRLSGDTLIPSAFGYNEASFRFHEGNSYTHLREVLRSRRKSAH